MLDPAEFFLDQADTSPHIQFIYDLKARRVVFVNEAYERLLGGHRDCVNDELPGLLARLHPDDHLMWNRLWRLWAKGGLHDETDVRLLPPAGTDQPEQWFCLTPHWHQDAAGHRWVGGTLRDSSAGKHYKATSDKFNTKKNTVLEILAHDLAGAFVMLKQLAEYVEEEMQPQASPQVAEMLRLMQTTSQRSVQLIHDLVDQEFQETATVALRCERVDLCEKLEQCLEPFRRAPGREALQLTCVLPPAPLYAEVDVNKLLQVVSNLVANAFKYTPDGGHVTVTLKPGDGSVRITVADEGIGIPERLLPVLFDRYTPASRPGLRGEPTTGLGLWLCKTLVELHRGTLSVRSTEGRGTTFTIELPTATPAP